ncbi:hypothetical protein LSAT2_018539 [Lamellibrachia satsuma]|nr:hypothetical protein LSAT2_018539 [Lamellibrachia satsuma]
MEAIDRYSKSGMTKTRWRDEMLKFAGMRMVQDTRKWYQPSPCNGLPLAELLFNYRRSNQLYVLLLCFFVASVIDEAVACRRRKCSPYNHDTHICCRGSVQSKEGDKNKTNCCGKRAYNRNKFICCWGRLFVNPGIPMLCCGMRPYTPLLYRCCPRFRLVHIAAMCPRY